MYILKWHWASDVNYTITNIHTSDIVTSLPCHHFCVQTVPPCLYKCLQHFSSSFGGINKHKNRWHYYYVMTKLNFFYCDDYLFFFGFSIWGFEVLFSPKIICVLWKKGFKTTKHLSTYHNNCFFWRNDQ